MDIKLRGRASRVPGPGAEEEEEEEDLDVVGGQLQQHQNGSGARRWNARLGRFHLGHPEL